MLFFYQAALALYAALLFSTSLSLAAALRQGNRRLSHVLHLLRLGLILSCCSYALRIFDPHHGGLFAFFSFIFGLSGTVLIWLSFQEHWKMQQERNSSPSAVSAEEEKSGPITFHPSELPPGLPLLTSRTMQVLRCAQEDARCRQSCVDTENLLLGLLQTPQSAGVCILGRLHVAMERVHLKLLGQMERDQRRSAKPPALTERAKQVFALAAQEAHRFDQASVGTEHLLLGLLLMGKGKAASVLFQEGVTVEGIRDEIIKAKKAKRPDPMTARRA